VKPALVPVHSPNQNRLLAALPRAEFDRIARHLEFTHLARASATKD